MNTPHWVRAVGLFFILAVAGNGLPSLASSLPAGSASAAETPYRIIDLGGTESNGCAINARGQVAGYVSPAVSGLTDPGAFLYTNGTMVDVGVPGRSSRASGVNASGQVMGWSIVPGADMHAFLYSNGTVVDLSTMDGGWSYPTGINASGQMVGYAPLGNATGMTIGHAFLYSDGAMKDLGTLGGNWSYPDDINDRGQVVGFAFTDSDVGHAFLYSDGTMIDLGTSLGGYSEALGINASGQVTGIFETSENHFHAFLYSNGMMRDLGTLGGFDSTALDIHYELGPFEAPYSSFPVTINDNGQVVGWSTTADGFTHAFLYSNGTMRDLGTLGGNYSYPYSMNASGQVVGQSNITGDLSSRAFLYSNDTMMDLASLLPADSQWTDIGTVYPCRAAINDVGQITGTGRIDGQRHAFLMTPNFPQNSILDSFDRANGKLGGNWAGEKDRDSYKIVDSRVKVRDGGPVFWKQTSFGTNQEAFVTLTKVDPNGSEQDLILKARGNPDSDNFGAIEVLYDAKARAVRVETLLPKRAHWTKYWDIPVTFVDGDQLGARVSANGEVRIYRNHFLLGTVTLHNDDQTFFNQVGGRIGLWFDAASNALFDDFGGGTIP